MNPMAALKPEEYEALRSSIAEKGVIVPIIRNQNGKIIDGHHRRAIAMDLGVDCPEVIRHYDPASKIGEEYTGPELADALGLNLQRRQLDDFTAGVANIQLLKAYGVQPGRGKNRQPYRLEEVAKLSGQTLRTFTRRREFAVLMLDPINRDLLIQFREGRMGMTKAMTEAKRRGSSSDLGPKKNLRPRVVKLPPEERGKIEGFILGLRWSHRELMGTKASQEWLQQMYEEWRSQL